MICHATGELHWHCEVVAGGVAANKEVRKGLEEARQQRHLYCLCIIHPYPPFSLGLEKSKPDYFDHFDLGAWENPISLDGMMKGDYPSLSTFSR